MEKHIVPDLIHKELSYKIVGCFYEVYNKLGPGFKESIYHNALSIEFKLQEISFEEEKKIAVRYKGKIIGYYVPDFLIEDKVIIEIKSVEYLSMIYEAQLYYYLKGTLYKLGYLVNFGGPKIEIKRRVFDSSRKNISGN